MPSPFPGMDPFLEAHWGDVHAALSIYARDQLQQRLPSDLVASVEEYVVLACEEPIEDWSKPQRWRPDESVNELKAALALIEPETELLDADTPIIVDAEPQTMREVRILDSQSRLVTSIEFLSPSNKIGEDERHTFRRKQSDLVASGVNIVEVDPILGGGWTIHPSQVETPTECQTPYRISVTRVRYPHRIECYLTNLRNSLPRIRIPLRRGETDIVLDLQELITLAYDRGAYHRRLNYAIAPRPPFNAEDNAWMTTHLIASGRLPPEPLPPTLTSHP